MVVIDVGLWTDGTHTFEVQESDDDTSYTAVAAADLQGTEPVVDDATDDAQVYELGYLGSKRYLRAISTVASATTGALYGASNSHRPQDPHARAIAARSSRSRSLQSCDSNRDSG